MPRYLRYVVIWLSCTAVSVTAVMLTVGFVVGSTRPTPPVARDVPENALATAAPSAAKPSPSRSAPASPAAKRTPGPASTPTTVRRPTRTPVRPATTAPPARAPRPSATPVDCGTGGAGVHTLQSQGGQAAVRFGQDAVCLVSAVPASGFTVSTRRDGAQQLTVTFSGDRHRSEIVATATPQSKATIREVSW
ncbi:hypothetical protein [Actinacidiphila glaucinigra]|uniref:hypothetical protein n=1 Tax=Actinacidiphila glaucinigra TaxID=235986 RepID=UPI002E2EDA70|nr:hypothetical protein [Actinacidiphila glaucinigra]